MPHYVTHDDEDAPGHFFMYSTVVDNEITQNMTPTQMFNHLIQHDYGSWIDPDSPGGNLPHMYWFDLHHCKFPDCTHSHGFWYVKQSDNYYTLPKDLWREE